MSVSGGRWRTTNEHGITARELDVLRGVAAGETSRETSRRLFLAEQTIRHHRASILRKLDARTAAQAVAVAFRTGILDTSDPPR